MQTCQRRERVWKCSRSKETKEKGEWDDNESRPAQVLKEGNGTESITRLGDERREQT